MSSKDYTRTARAIRDEVDAVADLPTVQATIVRLSLLGVAESLADAFADDNPRFDRSRFLDACGFMLD